jgi:hypothetical protein
VVSSTTACIFELRVEIEPRDTSFWEFVPFDLVGHLPNGSVYRATITGDSLSSADGGIAQTVLIRLESGKSGFARFILTTLHADSHLEFYDYPIRSNQRSIYLNCDGHR